MRVIGSIPESAKPRGCDEYFSLNTNTPLGLKRSAEDAKLDEENRDPDNPHDLGLMVTDPNNLDRLLMLVPTPSPEPGEPGVEDLEWSCQQVRAKIRQFLENGDMKVRDFCEAIGHSQTAYQRFMAKTGSMQGQESGVYGDAYDFFMERKVKGIPMPKKRKTGADEKVEKNCDVSGITLPGEENDEVEVYETCDEIRKKINAHLRKPGVTQAGFCRTLQEQYHRSDKGMQPRQLKTFLGYKGAIKGNTSSVFYAAYVYFEKLRIKEGKKKSKHREEMEERWQEKGGFDLDTPHNKRYKIPSRMGLAFDELGTRYAYNKR
ncbi:hypothetical protein K402DRAFT_460362 [Aulographum hederae CBS 113979]|uniref:DUF7726 domain-containing protein n=1 Tax=Aulographum hederae CBS 113979 TaxID=1176131 RepID=A0A6G1HB53_9PEZI|nr:hypothetical protein K402DRAFT_460362 [Aulographum hederae CBS 113979]